MGYSSSSRRRKPDIPAGYHFIPEDHQLLVYLESKIKGTLDPQFYPRIMEVDIYGCHPSEIFTLAGSQGDQEDDEDDNGYVHRYFLTRLKKTTAKGKRVICQVGSFGTWKGQNTKNVNDPLTGTLLGYNKYYKYETDKRGADHQGRDQAGFEWLMHEYSLLDNHEVVICRITNKFNKAALQRRNGNIGARKPTPEPEPTHQEQEPKPKRACGNYCSNGISNAAVKAGHLETHQQGTGQEICNVMQSITSILQVEQVEPLCALAMEDDTCMNNAISLVDYHGFHQQPMWQESSIDKVVIQPTNTMDVPESKAGTWLNNNEYPFDFSADSVDWDFIYNHLLRDVPPPL